MFLKEGDGAPAFQGTDAEGKVVASDQFRGRWLLLYFYPKDDTPGCTKEACGFRDHYAELQKIVRIIGVSADSAESHRKFAEKYRLPFPLIADPDRTIISAYHATKEELGKRVSFLIDPEGVIRKVYTEIETERHAGEVLEDIRQFQ